MEPEDVDRAVTDAINTQRMVANMHLETEAARMLQHRMNVDEAFRASMVEAVSNFQRLLSDAMAVQQSMASAVATLAPIALRMVRTAELAQAVQVDVAQGVAANLAPIAEFINRYAAAVESLGGIPGVLRAGGLDGSGLAEVPEDGSADQLAQAIVQDEAFVEAFVAVQEGDEGDFTEIDNDDARRFVFVCASCVILGQVYEHPLLYRMLEEASFAASVFQIVWLIVMSKRS